MPDTQQQQPDFPFQTVNSSGASSTTLTYLFLMAAGNDLSAISSLTLQAFYDGGQAMLAAQTVLAKSVDFASTDTELVVVLTGLAPDTTYYLSAFCDVNA
jgi:hypothetical protein